ncbi:MAG: hypothetical protein IJC59_00135 [Lachnospiraceae bacterium]|nr:hypothetical protein [Lachnospiraceae bacterium]
MRIHFDVPNAAGQQTEQNTISKEHKNTGNASQVKAIALDISGKVKDDFLFENQGRFTEKVMQAASIENYVALQRDFMTVMSNSMSGEDFAKLQEEGFHIHSMEPEEAVTILDSIKAAMVRSGQQIAGYNDDLSVEQLEELTGSSGYARQIAKQLKQADAPVTEENIRKAEEVLQKALALPKPGEDTYAFMISRGMEATVENLYKASFSSMKGSAGKAGAGYASGSYDKQGSVFYQGSRTPLSDADKAKIEEQIAERIRETGREADPETMARGKWLVEKGLALTPETLARSEELSRIVFPLSPHEIIAQVAKAIGEGRTPQQAYLTGDSRTVYEKAADYVERFRAVPMEAVDDTVNRGKPLTLLNLEAYQAGSETGIVHLEQRKVLEEVRLRMTVTANIKLLQSGFSIDTAPMEELIGRLSEVMQQWERSVLGNHPPADSARLYDNTVNSLRELPFMPLAVVGRIPFMERPTLGAVAEEGRLLAAAYSRAGESYEALMTAPRADMGDSIRKAFRNVDDILADMELEITEENRRAVRIMGYNGIHITEEALEKIKEADYRIRSILQDMKPALTLALIREGKNPLEMSLAQLEDYIYEQHGNQEALVQDTEKYSKFLYKLEQNREITEAERKAYVGVYRLFRQIEKSDGAVIGSLVAQGAELNFSNLLSAVRTRKAAPTDIRIDDTTGLGISSHMENSISDQIYEGLAEIRMANRLYRRMEPEQLLHMADKGIRFVLEDNDATGVAAQPDVSLEDMNRLALEASTDRQQELRYAAKQQEEIRQILSEYGSAEEYLKEYSQPITLDMLQSAGVLTGKQGSTFRKIAAWEEVLEEEDIPHILEEAEQFIDRLDQETKRLPSYEQMIAGAEQVLEKAIDSLENEAGYLDIKGIQMLCKQLHTAASLAREENYEIPLQIGEEITSVNLRIIRKEEAAGEVSISLHSETLGRVRADFMILGDSLEGSVLTDYMDGKERMESRQDLLTELLKETLEEAKIELKSILFDVGGDLPIRRRSDIPGTADKADTADLYRTAKGFLRFIQKLS